MSDKPPEAEAPSTDVPKRIASPNGHSPTNGPLPHSDLYELFQVGRQASADELADAYKVLRNRYNPQHNPGDPLARDIVRHIDGAYAVLIDPARRKAYDTSQTNGSS